MLACKKMKSKKKTFERLVCRKSKTKNVESVLEIFSKSNSRRNKQKSSKTNTAAIKKIIGKKLEFVSSNSESVILSIIRTNKNRTAMAPT
jgi:hypothetical protein